MRNGKKEKNKKQTFDDIKRIYNAENKQCGKHGYVYIPKHTELQTIRKNATWTKSGIVEIDGKKHKIPSKKTEYPFESELVTTEGKLYDLPCKKISCPQCRPAIIRKRHNQITQMLPQYGIYLHGIQTFPGKELRKKLTLDEQFNLMVHEKQRLDRKIKSSMERLNQDKELKEKNPFLKELTVTKKNGKRKVTRHFLPKKFNQISLLRAQSGKHSYKGTKIDEKIIPSGSPHYHNLTNVNINLDWLQEIFKKGDFKLGFSFIRENQDIVDYLAKDFYYPDEWFIPFNHRSISTSQDIKLDVGKGMIPREGTEIFMKKDLDFVEETLSKNGMHVPLENYVNMFQDVVKNEEKKDESRKKRFSILAQMELSS